MNSLTQFYLSDGDVEMYDIEPRTVQQILLGVEGLETYTLIRPVDTWVDSEDEFDEVESHSADDYITLNEIMPFIKSIISEDMGYEIQCHSTFSKWWKTEFWENKYHKLSTAKMILDSPSDHSIENVYEAMKVLSFFNWLFY